MLSSSKSSEYPSDSFSKDFHLNEPDFEIFSEIDASESVTFGFFTCLFVGFMTFILWNWLVVVFLVQGDLGECKFKRVGGSG